MTAETEKPVITDMNHFLLSDVAKLEKNCFSEPWSFALLEQELLNPLSRYFVMLYDRKVVGYCGYMFPCSEGEITRLAVDSKYRGRGFGRLLLLHLIADAVARELTALDLEVRQGNIAAICLYESLGFETVGLRRGYYKTPEEDAVLLRLSLQSPGEEEILKGCSE